MRNKILFFIFSVLLITAEHALGQKRSNVWITGFKAGMDFNTTPVTPLVRTKAAAVFNYQSTSICDRDGNLLFHTNGDTVFAGANYPIPKLYRWPWVGAIPPAGGHIVPLLCPDPGNDSLFYLFGVCDNARAFELLYVKLDKTGNFGQGDFVYPTSGDPNNYVVSVKKNSSMFVAGTQQCNRRDYWIAVHAEGRMQSFSLTPAGLNPIAVVSAPIPAAMGFPTLYKGNYNMKFSANGERLVLPNIDKRNMIVFDFNNITGVFSNPILLNTPKNLYTVEDVELSPDGSKLYFGGAYIDEESGAEIHDIYQMNLSAGNNSAAIEQTTMKVSPYPERVGPRSRAIVQRTMQLAPDSKIYINGNSLSLEASIIQEPNEPGKGCTYDAGILNMKSIYQSFCYNYISSESFTPKENGIVVKKNNCANLPVELGLFFKNVDSVKWDLGDPAAGSGNFPTTVQVEHTYPGPGTYIAKAIIYHRCFTDTATTTIEIKPDKAVKTPELNDTTLCIGQVLTLDVYDENATSYLWSDGKTTPQVTFKSTGPYYVEIKNTCSIASESFNLTFEKCDCEVFVPNAFTPNNDGVNDTYKPVVRCSMNEYSFKIFNRFGNMVFSASDTKSAWTGYVNNTPGSIGTYICLIRYKDPNNNKWITKKEFIQLIR